MFNLKQSIAEWRQKMLAAGIKSPVPLEELESHLREEIERQVKLGTDAQQAFEATVSAIGPAKELKTEFAKNRDWLGFLQFEIADKECEMKWTRILHIVFWSLFLLFFGGGLLLKKGGFSEMTAVERMSGLTAMALSYLLSCSGFLGRKIFPIILNKAKRVAICASCGVVIALWVMIFLVRVDCNMEQFTIEFLWAFVVPVGALSGLSSGLEIAAWKKTAA